jgi:hypothetical protein
MRYCDNARQSAEQHGIQIHLKPDIPLWRDRLVVGIGLGVRR